MNFYQNLYNVRGHMYMLNDENRMCFYYKKIFRNEKIINKVCCDIGSGTGILALFALMAGAKHVYMIENQLNMIDIIKYTMNLHDIDPNRYTIIQGWSTNITLPEPVDVIIHELIGEWGNGEQGLSYVSELKNRYLKLDGIIIPDIVEVHLTLQHTNDAYNVRYKQFPFLQDFKLNNIFDFLNTNKSLYLNRIITNKYDPVINNDPTYINDTSECNTCIIKYDLLNDNIEDINNKHIDLTFKPKQPTIVSLLSTLKYYCSDDINTYGDTFTNDGNWHKQSILMYPINIDIDNEITGYIDMKHDPRNKCSQRIEINLSYKDNCILDTIIITGRGFNTT